MFKWKYERPRSSAVIDDGGIPATTGCLGFFLGNRSFGYTSAPVWGGGNNKNSRWRVFPARARGRGSRASGPKNAAERVAVGGGGGVEGPTVVSRCRRRWCRVARLVNILVSAVDFFVVAKKKKKYSKDILKRLIAKLRILPSQISRRSTTVFPKCRLLPGTRDRRPGYLSRIYWKKKKW